MAAYLDMRGFRRRKASQNLGTRMGWGLKVGWEPVAGSTLPTFPIELSNYFFSFSTLCGPCQGICKFRQHRQWEKCFLTYKWEALRLW